MPLTAKGRKIKKNMENEYGAKKGKQVFYASQNKGTIEGTHEKGAQDAYVAGFVAKCASCGVDPEALVKNAGRGDMIMKLLARSRAAGKGGTFGHFMAESGFNGVKDLAKPVFDPNKNPLFKAHPRSFFEFATPAETSAQRLFGELPNMRKSVNEQITSGLI